MPSHARTQCLAPSHARTTRPFASAGIDLSTIADRRAILASVGRGAVADAIERTNSVCPTLLSDNPQLLYELQQQQLIELIREGNVDAAIEFAQRSLAPMAEQSPECLGALERTMLLLAYEDASSCPEAQLLSQVQRHRTMTLLNEAILTSQSQDKVAALPMLLRRLQYAQAELDRHGVVAPISIPGMEQDTPAPDISLPRQ